MRLVIWGAGGHGKVVFEVAQAMKAFEEIVFLDDFQPPELGRFCRCELVPASRGLGQLLARGFGHFLIAVGNNRNRARCFQTALSHGLTPISLIHPAATLSVSARIGQGTLVMPRVVINADADIGENCIINSGAIVEHDCKVGDHAHISPGAVLGGSVFIGAFAHIGMGANVLPYSTIGEEAVVGAGAVVLREVAPGVTVVGVPARVLEGNDV